MGKLFAFTLRYQPVDAAYRGDKSFWTDYLEFGDGVVCSKEEEIMVIGKTTAYLEAKKRANSYANEISVQLQFCVSADLDVHYQSNWYLSKSPKKNKKSKSSAIHETDIGS